MPTDQPSALNARYGVPGRVEFKSGPGGLTVVDVANDQASASIALQGAHLMTWAPRGQAPVIWLSPAAKLVAGKSIRGGVPVCWPWFGPHPSESGFPGHGFARTVPWELVDAESLIDGATRLRFRLIPNEATRLLWPQSTPVELQVTVGTALEFELVTRNDGATAVTIGDALHTYFEVSDIRQVTIRGLEGCSYIDKVDGSARKRQSGPVTIDAETDRLYLGSTADCLIDDPGMKRRLRIAKRGSRSSVVWNPWIDKAAKMGDFGDQGYLKMVCVESANADEDVVELAPGAEHRLWVRYTVETAASTVDHPDRR